MPYIAVKVCEVKNFKVPGSHLALSLDGVSVTIDHEYIFDSTERDNVFLKIEATSMG